MSLPPDSKSSHHVNIWLCWPVKRLYLRVREPPAFIDAIPLRDTRRPLPTLALTTQNYMAERPSAPKRIAQGDDKTQRQNRRT